MLSNIRILPRLLIGFGALILIIAGLSGYAVTSSLSSRKLFETVSRLDTADTIEQSVQKRVTEGRMQIWMAMATGEPEHWQKADAAFQIAHQKLDDLRAHPDDWEDATLERFLDALAGSLDAGPPTPGRPTSLQENQHGDSLRRFS